MSEDVSTTPSTPVPDGTPTQETEVRPSGLRLSEFDVLADFTLTSDPPDEFRGAEEDWLSRMTFYVLLGRLVTLLRWAHMGNFTFTDLTNGKSENMPKDLQRLAEARHWRRVHDTQRALHAKYEWAVIFGIGAGSLLAMDIVFRIFGI